MKLTALQFVHFPHAPGAKGILINVKKNSTFCIQNLHVCEFRNSHSGGKWDSGLLRSDAMFLSMQTPSYRRTVLLWSLRLESTLTKALGPFEKRGTTNPTTQLHILNVLHSPRLCVLCGSQNKQRLFPYTTLTDWVS